MFRTDQKAVRLCARKWRVAAVPALRSMAATSKSLVNCLEIIPLQMGILAQCTASKHCENEMKNKK
jgi:hypothetical protein